MGGVAAARREPLTLVPALGGFRLADVKVGVARERAYCLAVPKKGHADGPSCRLGLVQLPEGAA
jgi:hypothetical protein